MPFDPPRNLELEQHGAHNCRGGAREPHQIVDRYWCGTEKRDEAAALLITGCGIWRTGRLLGWLLRRRNTGLAADNRVDRCDHIRGFGHRRRALLEQTVRPVAARI